MMMMVVAGEGSSSGSEYDVFLSFRGPDTRQGFVDCIYETMTDAGIRVFIDNERLHVGEEIGEELIRAIDNSKICIPIFSKCYASSKWCLRELEYMMMGRSREGPTRKEVWPIFYDVRPSDVKLQTSLYKKDLEMLEQKHEDAVVARWKKSLRDVCKLKGWNPEESNGHGKLIKRIVQEVLHKTKKRYKNVSDKIVGIEDQVKAMVKLLDDQMNGVRFIVIYGMGGIGKTTLAKVIFNDISMKFQGCCFLSNIRESSQSNGIVNLQKLLLNDILRMSSTINDVDEGISEIKERFGNKNVLLVLDDVDDRDQIKKLAGKFDWFGRGSRIIITTRDKSIVSIELLSHNSPDEERKQKTVWQHGDVCFFEMKEMEYQHALMLFKRHACGIDYSSVDHDDLVHEIVGTTGGLPLALEVVGSYLYGQTRGVWRETSQKLKQAPHEKVQDVLVVSYEALEDEPKQIFLDIACFFTGERKCNPMYMWEACNFYPESGLDILLQRSLIKMLHDDVIWMHDQLKDFGREIVRREGLQTYNKSSRIWVPDEALHAILREREGNRHVVALNVGELPKGCNFREDAWKELANLRYLALCGGNLLGDFTNLLTKLRWLSWDCFPSNFEAKNFRPEKLAVLELSNTNITKNWRGWNLVLGSKLKVLKLSGCRGLTKTPDFSVCSALERLILQHCNMLTEIDGSIGKLEHLSHLEIQGSPNLKGLPQQVGSLKKLKKLILIGIWRRHYRVQFCLPDSLKDLKYLCHLEIANVGLVSLPTEIGQVRLLKYMAFKGCHLLTSLPESVWESQFISELNLESTRIATISDQIGNMKELKVLNMLNTRITMLPRGIGSLEKLEELNVAQCPLDDIPSEIGNLSSLRVLDLSHTNILELPSTVSKLSHLQSLDMNGCKRLRRVQQVPTSLSHLKLPYFSLQTIPDLSSNTNLVDLALLSNDVSFDPDGFLGEEDDRVDIDLRTSVKSLDLTWIERFLQVEKLRIGVSSNIFNTLPVESRSLLPGELRLSCSNTESLSQLPPNLSALIITKFTPTTIQGSLFSHLKNLTELHIYNSLTPEIQLAELEMLENVEEINVRNCQSLVRLSFSSCPKKVDRVKIRRCPMLVDIQGVDALESLHMLWVVGCGSLCQITNMSNLEKIRDFRLFSCSSMEIMPALPTTKPPIYLEILGCGKLLDFAGPQNLYGESRLSGNCFQCDLCNII